MASTADVPVLDSKPTSAGWTQQVEYSSEKLEEMKKYIEIYAFSLYIEIP